MKWGKKLLDLCLSKWHYATYAQSPQLEIEPNLPILLFMTIIVTKTVVKLLVTVMVILAGNWQNIKPDIWKVNILFSFIENIVKY